MGAHTKRFRKRDTFHEIGSKNVILAIFCLVLLHKKPGKFRALSNSYPFYFAEDVKIIGQSLIAMLPNKGAPH